jgi:hypothetical protein
MEAEKVIGAISPVVFVKQEIEGSVLKPCKLAFTSTRILYSFFNEGKLDLKDITGEKRWSKMKEEIRVAYQVVIGPEGVADMPNVKPGLFSNQMPSLAYDDITEVVIDIHEVADDYLITFKEGPINSRKFRAEKSSYRQFEDLIKNTGLADKVTIIK